MALIGMNLKGFFSPDVTSPAPTQKPLTKEDYLH